MDDDRTPVWAVHMGRPGNRVQGDSLERAENLHRYGYVALGWPAMGDMSTLPPDREAFQMLVRNEYGENASIQSVAAATSMLFRFVHEIQTNDVVISPSSTSDLIRVGRVMGPYIQNPRVDWDYPALRPVRWTIEISRSALSKQMRLGLQGQRCLYTMKAGADEFRHLA